MKPRKLSRKNRQPELFRIELVKIIDLGHSLVKLVKAIDWDRLDEVFG